MFYGLITDHGKGSSRTQRNEKIQDLRDKNMEKSRLRTGETILLHTIQGSRKYYVQLTSRNTQNGIVHSPLKM